MSEPAPLAASSAGSAGFQPAPDESFAPLSAAPVLFSHTGPFPHDAVIAGAQRLRTLPGLGENARLRLHAAFIELAQNIARYSADRAGPPGGERGAGAIRLLAPEPDGPLLLLAENPVAPETAPRLAAALAELAALDAAALKNLHRERRRSTPPPGSLGAGLGLIELHRHACAPVRHALAPAPPGRPPLLRILLPLARA